MWDPAVYGRYASERARPFADLLARVGAERPRAVVDLGCGPGDLTRTLAERWPGARVTGIDSSADMIDRARRNQREESRALPREEKKGGGREEREGGGRGQKEGGGHAEKKGGGHGEKEGGGREGKPDAESGAERTAAPPGVVDFRIGDVRDWRPDADVDVLVSNATLQWVPGHRELLADWAAALPPGAWIAVQVPGNFDAPSHRALRAVARSAPFAAAVGDVVRETPVDDAPGYASLLVRAGAVVDAWETVYVHLLPTSDAEHPVLRWMEGTALRPVRAALDEAAYQRFRAALEERLAEAYPARDGLVSFPFRRVFVVAQTSQE